MLKLWLHEARISNSSLLSGPSFFQLSRLHTSCWARWPGTPPRRHARCVWLPQPRSPVLRMPLSWPQICFGSFKIPRTEVHLKAQMNGDITSGVPLMELGRGAAAWGLSQNWLRAALGWDGPRWSGGSVSVSTTGPDDLSGERAAQARGPCELQWPNYPSGGAMREYS